MTVTLTATLLFVAVPVIALASKELCSDDWCCKGEPYDHRKYICCEEQLYTRPPNGQCCGPEPYDAVEAICCDKVVSQRPENAECCGEVPYDTRKQKCCNGKVRNIEDLLNGKLAAKEVSAVFLPCVECCGDSIIPVNPVTICCDGELQDRPANAACCGKEAFDSSLFFCCGGVIIKKAKYLDEYLTQLKAYLHLFGVTLEEYADRFKIKVKDLLPCMQCCGEEPYIDDDNKICCDGQIQDRPPNGECCGPKAFDSVKMICCDGVIQPRPPNAACCGQKAYDRLEQYCCSGEVVDLKKKKNPLIGLLHTL